MALSFRKAAEPEPTEALVFADGFADFDTLADEFDLEFGPGNWSDVRKEDTDKALEGMASGTRLAIVAVSSDNTSDIENTADLIRKARDSGLLVLLVVGDISTRTTHRLMREGVAEFTPYPASEGELQEAINRIRHAIANENLPAGPGFSGGERKGAVITSYGVAGGVGASTFIVNLAWEMCEASRKLGKKVALLDFNFQYGSVATYLDVPRREAVYELVSEAATLDQTGLTQALSIFNDRLHVLTAPRDALPLDIVSPSDIKAIIKLARESFDFVLIDMPQSLMNWSEQVYMASDNFYALMEVDMRSAQNMFRLVRTLKAEDMELDKIRFVLNRAPGYTDFSGKARVQRVAESLGVQYAVMLPDGGRQVINACDQGVPLASAASSNPLRKEIAKVAKALLEEHAAPQAAKA